LPVGCRVSVSMLRRFSKNGNPEDGKGPFLVPENAPVAQSPLQLIRL